MPQHERAADPDKVAATNAPTHNLILRVLSSLVLAPLALAAAYLGGIIFIAFWVIAAIGVLYEWMRLVARPVDRHAFFTGICTIVASAGLVVIDRPVVSILIIALGALGAAAVATARRPAWIAMGVAYAGLLMAAPVRLREDPDFGFIAILIVFAVVWTTDIFGYFVGRAIGGPKLAPAISPKKTWSGAITGLIAAIVGALAVAYYTGLESGFPLAILALLLSIFSQAGDLLESGVKRHFNTKDAGSLIPGHGGLMDRLDGFWAASVAAAVFGVLRGGFEAPAQALIVW